MKMFPTRLWKIEREAKDIYLTFDDGPHPEITPQVLDLLKEYNAKATFFCVGENVKEYPGIFSRIISEGHKVGNHTMHHLNGSKIKDDVYLGDILEAKQYIDTDLFRPPYGKLSSFQAQQLAQPLYKLKVVMWSVLSGDFDKKLSLEKCLNNVTLKSGPGDIVVFHDSEKAKKNLLYALPKVLDYFTQKGYSFKAIV